MGTRDSARTPASRISGGEGGGGRGLIRGSAFLDTWSRLDSPIHRVSSEVKLGVAVAIVVTVAILPLAHAWVFAGTAFFLALVAGVSRIPASFLLKRLLLLEPVVAGVAVLSVLQPGGVGVALSILVKSTLSLTTMLVLTNTTPFSELLRVLRALSVPGLLVTVLALLYRYLFVLTDEAARMRRARTSRTFTRSRAHVWRSTAELAGSLFVRSTERAERIYAAMCARGWR